MIEFLFEYGLFTAKVLPFFVLAVLAIGFIISLAASRSRKGEDTLEIENINDELEELQDVIESEIFSKPEYKALLKQRKKADKEELKERKKHMKAGDDEPFKPRLFIIRFDGDLHASEVENLRKSITTILTVAKECDEVLIVLDSSGGMVHNYGLAASQLSRIKHKNIKLTVAVDLVAASGGYMMACVADKIIAAPFALLGSIGVLAELPNFNKLLDKHNIEIEHHTAGEYKTTLTMLGKNTKKGREKFQEELEDVHVLFKKFVRENRPRLDIDKIATGEAWYGAKCIELKLVDELKTSDDYILERAANCDVFEITFTVNESLRDKLSALLYKSTSTAIEKLWHRFTRKFNYIA